MNRRARLLLVLLSTAALAALIISSPAQTQTQAAQSQNQAAQAQPQSTQPQTPPTPPPDRKAFTDANAIKEPDKKIEAMEQFMKDFPDSQQVTAANQAIFETLVKNHPDDKTRILDQAGRMIDKATQAQAKINAYNTIGTQLCDAGMLLDNAEKFAVSGIALVAEELTKAQANPPAPENPPAQGNRGGRGNMNPAANLGRLKSNLLLTLGRIYVKEGKLDQAEKNLKEALAANSQLTAATLGLAEVYEKRGDAQNALTNYISAAALSKIPAASRQALNALYAKAHNGSMAGLEELLDAKYLEANPPPFAVDPYKPTEKRTDRVVLTEVFTGSGCPPCVAADLAADLAMERYNTKELAVIIYHEHIPQPDPMTTPQTTARFKYYNGTGVPTMVVDGKTSGGGGGARNFTKSVFDRITQQIEKELELPPDANLTVSAVLNGTTVKAGVKVDHVTSESPDIKLHIVLAEGKLRYTGENGVRFHPMVVRSMAETKDGAGFPVTTKDSQAFAWEFDLTAISAAIKKHLDEYEAGGHRGNAFTFTEKKYEINPKDLLVIAFVQDEKTKNILQSIITKVETGAAIR
jgi:tetratricopeptide (TPR) repeat protein